jgi:ubiquinone/menaquinone biosynthesis C-methylase UbiE
MSPRQKGELKAEIERQFRILFGPNAPREKAERWLAFELSSVEIHRQNLVPFVRGHGASANDRMLDFGSGSGSSACAMALDLGVRVVGIEPRDEKRNIARLWAEYYGVEDQVDFHFLRDTLHLPYADASFDYVLSSSVLEYISGSRTPFLAEMWRVLKPGGRLIIAGTSNAVWPREIHSKTWTVNWMPNLGPRIRAKLGRNPNVERGITFGEIESGLPGARFVRGGSDEVGAFAERFAKRTGPLARILQSTAKRALEEIDRATRSALAWPLEAFLPWLNVAFEKPLAL